MIAQYHNARYMHFLQVDLLFARMYSTNCKLKQGEIHQ